MRRMIGAAAVAMLGLVVVGCQPAPTEPAMTITAKAPQPTCRSGGETWVTGTVTPSTATKSVTLQRTVDGKWVDWKWYENSDTDDYPHVLTSPVQASTGKYQRQIVGSSYYAKLKGTIHVRMRSAGGGYVSPGLYLTFPTC